MRPRFTLLAAAAFALMAAATPADAQKYPDRQVRVIVTFAAGGARNLTRTFLLLALVLLVAETLVARRGRARTDD